MKFLRSSSNRPLPRKPRPVDEELHNRPFQDIKTLLETKSISLPNQHHSNSSHRKESHNPELERKLFAEAMEGVVPILREKCIEIIFKTRVSVNFREKEDNETLSRLRNLVEYGTEFNISDTPEYIEGTGYHVHPEVARRLHRGDYSIQAHIDLHGLNANDAKEVFEKFMKWAVTHNQRGVLIIHGRGLSSPSEPILKKKVIECLTHGTWRKWVVAYCSARPCDGGTGATYVLLRQRPVTKRLRIKQGKEIGKRNG